MEITIKVVDGKVNINTSGFANKLEVLGLIEIAKDVISSDASKKKELEEIDNETTV